MTLNDLLVQILWLPEQASTVAARIDNLHFWVIGTTMFASLSTGAAAYYCIFRFRRRPGSERTPLVHAPGWYEPAVIIIPLAIFLLWWAIGYRDFIYMTTPPPDCFDVYVTGKQWMWKFSYPGGPNSIDTLHVPAGRPVRLLLTSRDVIHSFYVPDFRVKYDVLPGRHTQLWFQVVRPGRHQILCAEMCGVGHSTMWGEVVAHDPAEFEEWLAEQRRGLAQRRDVGQSATIPVDADLPRQGQRIAAEAGCLKCHSVDGTAHIGPSFLGLYLRREPMSDGSDLLADEEYLTQSIVDPLARIVRGYQPVMPTYQGRLSPAEVGALLEYLRTLQSPSQDGDGKGQSQGHAESARLPVYSPLWNGAGEPGASPFDPLDGQTPDGVPVVGGPR